MSIQRPWGTFGEALRTVRLALRLRQREFAERLHVSRETVSKWETGRCEPLHEERLKIAMVDLHCSIGSEAIDELGVPHAASHRPCSRADVTEAIGKLRADSSSAGPGPAWNVATRRETIRLLVAAKAVAPEEAP
jgi:transcriptional regulator with XRE-family HTH domain